jgi:hypothetical protein
MKMKDRDFYLLYAVALKKQITSATRSVKLCAALTVIAIIVLLLLML